MKSRQGPARLDWHLAPNGLETRLTVAVVFVGMVSLIVQNLSGDPWQLDSHTSGPGGLLQLAGGADGRRRHRSPSPGAEFPASRGGVSGWRGLGRVLLHAGLGVLETAVRMRQTNDTTETMPSPHPCRSRAPRRRRLPVQRRRPPKTEAIAHNLAVLARATSETGSVAEAGRGASGQLSAHCAKMSGSARDFVGSLQAA